MSCQHSPFFRLVALGLCALALSTGAMAAEVPSGEVYCFSESDFSPATDPLSGVCITALPDPNLGVVRLGARIIRSGDILTAAQLQQLTYTPAPSETDYQATISYLPVYSGRVEPESTMTISIHGREDKAPIAEDSDLETYKNLENRGKLKASDPEGQPMTYRLIRQPKRGTVELHEDGSFTYAPKKNKVGTDSFTYTATDPAGNVSREATVVIEILKPTDARQYTDTAGLSCSFAAEWLRNTGIFTGETVSGQSCFSPDSAVTRGEFLAMLMQTLELPVDRSVAYTGFADQCEDWLKPYLAAALRCGIITGYPSENGAVFCPQQVITGNEAAVMLQNALCLAVPTGSMEETTAPTWAADACAAVSAEGFAVPIYAQRLTRADAAQILYQVSKYDTGAAPSLFTAQ